jgi:hypothetical protein
MLMKKGFSFTLILAFLFGLAIFYGYASSRTAIPQVVQDADLNTLVASQPPTLVETLGSRPTQIPPLAPSGVPPTWTPLPTYPPDQARQVVMDLYENGPCRLPCWWGITPGKTDWRDAWQFLGRFATNQYPGETLLLESKDLPGYMYYQVHLDVPKTLEENNYSPLSNLWFVINIKTFKVDYIDVDTGYAWAYTLPGIFANYGKPQQIYVLGGENPISSAVVLYLYYPQYGFISAQGTDVERDVWKTPAFTTCFEKVNTDLWLWPQEQQLDFNARMKVSIDPFTLRKFKPLDKVSNLTADKFYDAFSSSHQPPCVEFDTASLLRSW